MEKLPQLKYSCCGCGLAKGTKIIGWVCMILYIFLLLSSIACIGNCGNFKLPRKLISRSIRTSWGILCFSFVQAIINFVLLLGVCKKKLKFFQVYLIVNLTLLIVAFILLFDNHVNWISSIRVTLMIYLVLHIYFFLVVHSYYRTVKDAEANTTSV